MFSRVAKWFWIRRIQGWCYGSQRTGLESNTQWKNRINCPDCGRRMSLSQHGRPARHKRVGCHKQPY